MQRPLASFSLASIVGLVALGMFTLPVYAQNLGSTNVQPLTLTSSPQYPAPYQTIAITPQSTSFDISNAIISVTNNGRPVYSGSGGADIPVTIGGPGTSNRITVKATVGGSSYTQSITLRPASVALVVEPISTTHAFYAGRALTPSQGRVRIVAIPDVRTSPTHAVSPSSLIYIWKLGDQELQDNSGVGQAVLNATAPQQYRDANITVTVQTQDSSVIAQSGVTISPIDPNIEVYENDPLMGPLFDNALTTNTVMNGNEETFRAVPYYFSTTPSLAWTINGATSGSNPDITLQSSGSGQGTASVSVTANQANPLLSAAESLSVLFGQKTSLGIFGL